MSIRVANTGSRSSSTRSRSTHLRSSGWALAELSPLQNGPALRVLEALRRLCPAVPHVACFDTAFHASIPDEAAFYALPSGWIDRLGLRRFGFHGISHAWSDCGDLRIRDGELRR